MKPLHHYVIVRRDLPLGVVLAMVAHAAGESFYKKACPNVSFATTTMASGGYVPPAPGSFVDSRTHTFTVEPFDPAQTVAVVLGARNEGRLLRLLNALERREVQHVAVRETDGEYAGQLMAVGIVPGDREHLAPFVGDFHMLKELGS